ncbi:MAG TPA: hypothetical protein VNT77_04670 [Allosphingosinicella sp.]|nr:hypothetical protein [Allosphingosinicella sp.]
MSKPPKSTPHSDIDGVNQDERLNVDSATESGQGSEELERARDEAKGRPPYADDQENREDRTG